jgi:saccharopine dehydrogenase-like NADP-dependent oxidoreductase
MALKILIIGATGHIGGAVLDVIHRQYSANIDIEILVQVRNESDAAAIVNPYNVTPLLGSLDEIEPLLEHITSADIVISKFSYTTCVSLLPTDIAILTNIRLRS